MQAAASRMAASSKRQRVSQALCAILLVQSLSQLAKCQISDGDEQFEAVHQDIGRISGLANSAQVAPQSQLVARQPHQQQQQADQGQQLASPPAASLGPQLAPEAMAQVFGGGGGGGGQSRGRPAGASRKPNRITLVARRDPLPATQTTVAQPTLIAAQLPAPPQQQQQQQFVSSPSSSAAQEQASFTPSFAPLAPSPVQPARGFAAAEQPALTSFRSTNSAPPAATSSAVSARHSALMAQVAAERAAAASLIGNEPSPSGLAPLLAPESAPARQQQQQQQQQQQFQQAQPSQSVTSFVQQPRQQQQQQAAAAVTQLAAPTSAQGQAVLAEEPLVAPSFEQVLSQGCPLKGVFSWENKDHCDRYYMCTNGTFTEEACPNGLAWSQQGAVYQHCAYNWNVDCGQKKTSEPIASPGCPWQFGLFPIAQNGRCSIDYYACEWGVPETKRCSPEGLFYDDRIKGCQWADQLGCKSEGLLNFKCPPEDEDNPYWPYPRYYHDAKDIIVCVNEQPRLVHCNEDQLVDPNSLACMDVNKKKKKNF